MLKIVSRCVYSSYPCIEYHVYIPYVIPYAQLPFAVLASAFVSFRAAAISAPEDHIGRGTGIPKIRRVTIELSNFYSGFGMLKIGRVTIEFQGVRVHA